MSMTPPPFPDPAQNACCDETLAADRALAAAEAGEVTEEVARQVAELAGRLISEAEPSFRPHDKAGWLPSAIRNMTPGAIIERLISPIPLFS